ncbi:MAG: ATP-binding protein, partial [Pseudanabaena sp. ELA748]
MERGLATDAILRSKCKEKDWAAVLSASLAAADQEEKSDRALSSYEVIAAAALYHRNKGVDTRMAERDVCAIAVTGISYALLLNDRSESYYFLTKEDLEVILVNAVACAVLNRDERTDDGRALRTLLAGKLAAMWEGKATEPNYLWLQQILSSTRLIGAPDRSRSCASVIADILWGAFTGLDVDVAQPRAKLLLLGYRMRLIDEVVGHLAREHAKPLDHHVVQFLRAVQVAEANPTAWDEAWRLAQSFLEQVPPRGMRPWRLFIDTLNRAGKRDASEEACAVSLENYVFEPDGRLMLELRLSPSAYNFPASLFLEIQCAAGSAKGDTTRCDITDGDVLACERVVRVAVPVDKENSEDVVVLGYRLTGATTQNDPIDVRGEWRAERARGRYQPLPAPGVARAWKGRDGKPVDRSMNVFHGREKEQGDIDNVLNGEGGVQGSAMIIGQRRIGKTSLLMEAHGHYSPQDGHVCGVFVDFSGISKKAREEPLSKTFFRALTTLEDAGGRNRGLNADFKAKLGHEWNEKLRHGLDPVTSLPSALTRFVDRMSEHTNGKVRRVAFFVDEFQSVFKFDRKEVDEVMWALRPIVQMSPSISLILAGSGLTRELVRGYDQAFFGSITTISLRSFMLPADFEAVRDTLLPEDVRDQLCPPGRDLGALVRCAFELCQGHPWFLSMLGYSAAQILEGRPLSPALLNYVAREMIHGHADFQDQETGAARFYGHIFDTLDTIGRRGDIAKLVLDNIARQVTLDWPWLTADQAIHGPMLVDAQVSEREAL